MSNALALFDTAKMAVPSHVANFFEEESNIADKVTVPSLGYEGKVWQISLDGTKTKLTKRNAEGDEEPVAVMRVVLLDYNKSRGRAYYTGAYDPAKPGTPVCWSDNGVAPDATAPEKQHSKCEGCPMAVKGSKITEQGKSVTACSSHRMVAVVPANRLDFTPLRMKLAITSLWDKTSPELEQQGWYAFDNYTDFLRTKGVKHTAAIVTKMRFDPNVAFPKVMFSPDRWLEDAELQQVAPVAKSETVAQLLAGTFTPAGADSVPKSATVANDDADDMPAPAPVAVAPKPTTARVKPKAAPAAPIKMLMDDDDEPPVAAAPTKPVAAAPKPAPAAAGASVIPKDVQDLLAEWDDD